MITLKYIYNSILYGYDNMTHCLNIGWRVASIISLGILTIFFNSSFLSTFVNADDLNPGIYSIDSKPFGVSYGNWLAKYSQWFIQFPADLHPREHYTPERCSAPKVALYGF